MPRKVSMSYDWVLQWWYRSKIWQTPVSKSSPHILWHLNRCCFIVYITSLITTQFLRSDISILIYTLRAQSSPSKSCWTFDTDWVIRIQNSTKMHIYVYKKLLCRENATIIMSALCQCDDIELITCIHNTRPTVLIQTNHIFERNWIEYPLCNFINSMVSAVKGGIKHTTVAFNTIIVSVVKLNSRQTQNYLVTGCWTSTKNEV